MSRVQDCTDTSIGTQIKAAECSGLANGLAIGASESAQALFARG